MAKKHKVIWPERCCNQHYLKVGYIFRRKNEVYICPKCGRIFYSKDYCKIKKWWLSLFKNVSIYDDTQVRLYWIFDKPTVIADNTGATISNLERDVAELEKEYGRKM